MLVVAVTSWGVVSGLFERSPEVVSKSSIVSDVLTVPWGVVSTSVAILVSVGVSTSSKSEDLTLGGSVSTGEVDIVVSGAWLGEGLTSVSLSSGDSGSSSLVTVSIVILLWLFVLLLVGLLNILWLSVVITILLSVFLSSVLVSDGVWGVVELWDGGVGSESVTHDGSLAGWVALSISVELVPSVGNSVSLSVSETVSATISIGPSLGVASTNSVSVLVVR